MRETPAASATGSARAALPVNRCPVSGARTAPVGRVTVKALLSAAALRALPAGEFRFCPDPACDVVYVGTGGVQYGTADVRVPVWHKEPPGMRTLCYCFGESEPAIRDEIARTGCSRAAARVREGVRASRCACDVRNPRGVCCLGDVHAAVSRIAAATTAPHSEATRS